MNFQNLNFDHVEAPRHWPPQFKTSETSPDSESTVEQHTGSHHRRNRHQPIGLGIQSSAHSLSPQTSIVPPAPTPPSPPSASTAEIYGPDRYYSYTVRTPDSRPIYRHPGGPPRSRTNTATSAPRGPTVRFDEAQLAILAAQNVNMAGVKDALTIAAGKVTPGVDDGPYIQYAIQALTRDRHGDVSDNLSEGDFEEEMEGVPLPPPRTAEDDVMGYPPLPMPQTTYAGHRDIRREPVITARSDSESFAEEHHPRLSEDDQFRTLSPVSSRVHTPFFTQSAFQPQNEQRQPQRQQVAQQAQQPPAEPVQPKGRGDHELWVPVTKEMRNNFYPNDITHPALTFKPRILRPFSVIIFIMLCMLEIVGLIFSAVYSSSHNGLTPYPGSIYSGQYFVFRLLPQLLAAIILIYAQAIVTASLRLLPFASMASEDARKRYLALFQRLYCSTCFLLPDLVGPWQFKIFSIASWVALFTIPLQSALFTCIFVDEKWIWATVQGVAWALVAFYLILAISAVILMAFWFRKWTGLMWDIRSIADILPLLNRSNTTQGYRGADTADSKTLLKGLLHARWFDRLGYWRAEDTQTGSIWYGVGASGTSNEDPRAIHELMSKRASNDASLTSHDLAIPTNMPQSRYRYLSWFLRDAPLIAFTIAIGGLLLALLIVSFLPQTRLEDGFRPLLPAKPGPAAFSSANFLYSFLPSLLGMILYLLFQNIDQALRIAQPWGELSRPEGGPARKSILADYISCSLPLEAAWHAARNGHWRVAIISFLASIFIGIPILGGGLFMALTTRPEKEVRMLPNIPVYGVLLALLFLYVGALTLLLPRRRQLRLPHAVTCLAGIISLCSANELTRDAAFRSVRSRSDLESRLGVDKRSDPREESLWIFGVVPGKEEHRLSVRRLRRFTEKTTMTRSYTRSMV